MLPLPTAVLLHHTPAGSHHDWLVADPRGPAPTAGPRGPARLWTARVAPPPRDWAPDRALVFTQLPPHRRIYLAYQGPISGGRGRVVRIDRGIALPHLWTDYRIDLFLSLTGCAGRLTLRRIGPDRWLGRWQSE